MESFAEKLNSFELAAITDRLDAWLDSLFSGEEYDARVYVRRRMLRYLYDGDNMKDVYSDSVNWEEIFQRSIDY